MKKEIELKLTKIQNKFIPKIYLKNTFDINNIKLLAGVDLAYWQEKEKQYAVCCIVVTDYHTKQVIEKVSEIGEIKVPYIAGFLAFRELPLIKKTVKLLQSEPDIFLFDGNGYLHYRHMGIATHASFYINKPTIGIAKSYLKIKEIEFTMPENREGAYSDIIIENEVYGRALRTHKDVKPIFVSCGNYIDLETSTKIILSQINRESRQPIPVRLADLETHIVRQNFIQKQHK